MSSTPTKADQENTGNIIEALTTVSKQLSSYAYILNTYEDVEERHLVKRRIFRPVVRVLICLVFLYFW